MVYALVLVASGAYAALANVHEYSSAVEYHWLGGSPSLVKDIGLIFMPPLVISALLPAVVLLTASVGMLIDSTWGYRLLRMGALAAAITLAFNLVQAFRIFTSPALLLVSQVPFIIGIATTVLLFVAGLWLSIRGGRLYLALPRLCVALPFFIVFPALIFGWHRVAWPIVMQHSEIQRYSALGSKTGESRNYTSDWNEEDLVEFRTGKYVIRLPRQGFGEWRIHSGNTDFCWLQGDTVHVALMGLDGSLAETYDMMDIEVQEGVRIDLFGGQQSLLEKKLILTEATMDDFSFWMSYADALRLRLRLELKQLTSLATPPYADGYRRFRTPFLEGVHGDLGAQPAALEAFDKENEVIVVSFFFGENSTMLPRERERFAINFIASIEVPSAKK